MIFIDNNSGQSAVEEHDPLIRKGGERKIRLEHIGDQMTDVCCCVRGIQIVEKNWEGKWI